MKFDWTHARAFLTTVETGSLSAAARHLGLTQPTLGRQVTALETALGVTLFERVGKGLSLTDTGKTLLPHARIMAQGAEAMALAAAGAATGIEGEIRLSASDIFCAHILPPVLARLRDLAPRLTVTLLATNDLSDILQREADIAIRHVQPKEPELIARKLGDRTGHLYAATSYLEKRGRPDSPQALAGHDIIAMGASAHFASELTARGFPVTPEMIRLTSESGLVVLEMLRAGLGIAPMVDSVAASLRGVEPLLPETGPITFPVWLVTHRELRTSRRIRLVFDHLAEALGAP